MPVTIPKMSPAQIVDSTEMVIAGKLAPADALSTAKALAEGNSTEAALNAMKFGNAIADSIGKSIPGLGTGLSYAGYQVSFGKLLDNYRRDGLINKSDLLSTIGELSSFASSASFTIAGLAAAGVVSSPIAVPAAATGAVLATVGAIATVGSVIADGTIDARPLLQKLDELIDATNKLVVAAGEALGEAWDKVKVELERGLDAIRQGVDSALDAAERALIEIGKALRYPAWFLLELTSGSANAAEIDPAAAAGLQFAKLATPPRMDPFVLDLDGDGLESRALDAARPIFFDLDADGVATNVGWILPDDGFLVKDRNGNGVIDDGAELFGDATPLPFGTKARDGFDALVQEDTNGDGWVDGSDAGFDELRVWRDLDQDGRSSEDELFSLTDAGVAAIRVSNTATNQLLPGGSRIADLGVFRRVSGGEGVSGVLAQTADIDLAQDLSRQQRTPLPLDPSVLALPDAPASGGVRTLREAATLSLDLRATLFADGKVTDLNTLADLTGWMRLTAANDINDLGDIVGEGLNEAGDTRAFLLLKLDSPPVPVPEPSTLMLLISGVALVSLGVRRGRSRQPDFRAARSNEHWLTASREA